MGTKAGLVVGGLVGYLLGTRAGRERFDTIAEQARRVWADPRVQDKVGEAGERASAYLAEKAPDLQAKVTEALRQQLRK